MSKFTTKDLAEHYREHYLKGHVVGVLHGGHLACETCKRYW